MRPRSTMRLALARRVFTTGLAALALGGCLDAREGRRQGGASGAAGSGAAAPTIGWTSGRFVLGDPALAAPVAPAASGVEAPAAALPPSVAGPVAPANPVAPADPGTVEAPGDPDPGDGDGDGTPDAMDPCVGFANAALPRLASGTSAADLCAACRSMAPRPLVVPTRATVGETVQARLPGEGGRERWWAASLDAGTLARGDALPGLGLVRTLDTPGAWVVGLVRERDDGSCEVGEAEVDVAPDRPLVIQARAEDPAGRPLGGAVALHVRPADARPDGPADCASPLRCDGGRGPESVRWGDVAPEQHAAGAALVTTSDATAEPLALDVDLGAAPGGRATVVVDVWVDGVSRGELRQELPAHSRWQVGVLDGAALVPDGAIAARAACAP